MRSAKQLLFGSVLIAAAAFAQSDKGTIAGTVSDPGSTKLAGASIQAKNVDTGGVYKASASAAGKYTIEGLPAGRYDLSVAVAGLRPYEQKGIRVEAAKTLSVDIRLQEGTQLSTLGEDALSIAADMRKHAPPSGPTPRTFDGKPDFSGVWWTPSVVDPGKPEWLPAAEKVAAQRRDNNRKDSPQSHCLPSAVLRLGPLYEMVQSKAVLVVISDDDFPGFHQIYIDGRSHPKDPDPQWYGHSIGRWEGDTLIVDRVTFEEPVWLDQDAHPHSDKLHVIERYRRPDLGHLETEITVEDPGVLAKPWTLKRVSDLGPNESIREFMCTENNKDVEHMLGK
jgi:hypothetical protein